MSRRRLAVIAGSFWRMGPAAGVRGVGVAPVVEEDVGEAVGGDRGFFLADGARRSVARVGEGGLPGLLQLGVELLEGRPRHVDLAPPLQDRKSVCRERV